MVSRSRAVFLLLELIEEMAAERGHRWGWKNEVAGELTLHPSAVGKLVNGDRDGISLATVEKIANRSARYRAKIAGEDPAPAPTTPAERPSDVSETRSPRRDAADAGHWLKLTLDAWGFEGKRREAVISQLEAAAPPLQPPTVRALVDMWLRLEKLEASAAAAGSPLAAGHEPRPRRGLEQAKPRKRLK